MLRIAFVVFALVAIAASKENPACPNAANISPCTCQIVTPKEKETWVGCSYLPSLAALTTSVRGMKGYEIDKLVIELSDIGYIPNNLFLYTPLKEIILADMNLNSLTSQNRQAFEGQAHSLQSISIRRCTLNPSSGFDWSILDKLHALKSFDLFGMDLSGFPAEWFHFTTRSLRFVHLAENEIHKVHKNAFRALSSLFLLDLSENRIKTLSRSMFPMPADSLTVFLFNDNEISSLPEDIFSSMTALRRINLANNMLQTIDIKVWGPKYVQLTHLNFEGNDIPCDCGIFWTLESVLPESYRGVCKNSTDGSTKDLSSLYPWYLTEDGRCPIDYD